MSLELIVSPVCVITAPKTGSGRHNIELLLKLTYEPVTPEVLSNMIWWRSALSIQSSMFSPACKAPVKCMLTSDMNLQVQLVLSRFWIFSMVCCRGKEMGSEFMPQTQIKWSFLSWDVRLLLIAIYLPNQWKHILKIKIQTEQNRRNVKQASQSCWN